jgi:hypothetical protein
MPTDAEVATETGQDVATVRSQRLDREGAQANQERDAEEQRLQEG